MTVMQSDPPPAWALAAGFAAIDNSNTGIPADGFDSQIGPLLYRLDGDRHEFLLQVQQRHINKVGIAHGGMLAALTDVACSRAFRYHIGPVAQFVTISLTHEFIGAAPRGCWLVARCRIRQEGGSIIFIDCEMHSDDRLIGLSRCVMKKVRSRS